MLPVLGFGAVSVDGSESDETEEDGDKGNVSDFVSSKGPNLRRRGQSKNFSFKGVKDAASVSSGDKLKETEIVLAL